MAGILRKYDVRKYLCKADASLNSVQYMIFETMYREKSEWIHVIVWLFIL